MHTPTISESRASYAGFGTRQVTLDGTGPCIVLLHGFGHPSDCWRSVLERLARSGNSAISVDLPGFGEADPLRPGPQMPQLEEFVTELVEAAGRREPVVLVGNSLGAAVAVRVASAERGLPIGALVPTGVAGFGWTPLVHGVAAQKRLPFGLIGSAPIPDAIVRLGLYGNPRQADPHMIALMTGQLKSRDSRVAIMKSALRFLHELPTTGVDPIHCPTTIVHGKRDRLVSMAASRRLHNAIPGSHFVLLDEAGHCPHLDAPDVIASIATGYTRAVREAKSA